MKGETPKNNIEEQFVSLLWEEWAWELKERKITFFFNLGVAIFLSLLWSYVLLAISNSSVTLGVAGTVLALAFRFSLSMILGRGYKADERCGLKSLTRRYIEQKIVNRLKENSDKPSQVSSPKFLETENKAPVALVSKKKNKLL